MSLFRGAAITGGLTLVSRVLGFIRDLLVARLFGASPLADAYFVAFRIPNLLRSFVAEGALNSAFVPVFVAKVKEGTTQRNLAFRQALGFVCVLSGGITLLGMLFAPQIVAWMAPGFNHDGLKGVVTVDLTRIMFPLLVCVSLVAAIGGALNALKIFGAPGLAQIAMNLGLIAGAYVAARSEAPIYVLAWSVIVGGIAQIVVQIPALRRAGLPLLPSLQWITEIGRGGGDVVGPICRLLLPATLGAAVYQGTIFLATVFASLLGDGAVSWLFYADRLTQLPIGIFSIALASVLLPVLSKAKVDGDAAAFNGQLTRSLRWTSFVLIPMSVWLWIDADAMVRILFERGSFSAHDTAMTAYAVRGLALGLWAMSCQSMVTRAFIASRDTRTPSLLGLFSLVAYVLSAFMCVGEVRAAVGVSDWSVLPSLGHAGLALSSSIATLISFLVCLLIALRRFHGLALESFIASTVRCTVAGVVGGGVFYLIAHYMADVPWIFVQAAAGSGLLISYLFTLASLRSIELSECRNVILSRVRRAK